MKKIMSVLAILLLTAAFLAGCGTTTVDEDTVPPVANQSGPENSKAPTDFNHAAAFTGTFDSPQQVTETCLICHTDQAEDVMHTAHWNWSSPTPQLVGSENREDLGKKNGINNFCIAVPSNEEVCMSCHIGYGTDFEDPKNIDCLVCHAGEGSYKKTTAEDIAENTDLAAAARSVGKPSVENCGTCHFYAGGGDAVKQGDLDSTMITATREHDVHLGGAGMECVDCHADANHQIKGSSIHVTSRDANTVNCESCHQNKPHKNDLINGHLDTIACQTCHIPTFSKGMPTKMEWDWSTAGQDLQLPKDQYGKETYTKKKGTFVWEQNVTPTYAWYNGKVERYLLGDHVNQNGVTTLAKPAGSIEDPSAKIYPFKLMKGKQPADTQNNYLLTPNVTGYWKHFDWDKALADGAKTSGLEYSGQYEFVSTEMYLSITHEVVPKESALTCTDCHADNGVLNFKALGYEGDPMKARGRSQ